MALRSIGGLAIQTVKAIGTFATRALTADVPDSTATGGNARGTNSVDLQTVRAAATQVASGARSAIVGGQNNTASGSQSFVVGSDNVVSGTVSVAIGGFSSISGTYGIGLGLQTTDRGRYATISAGSGSVSVSGDRVAILSAQLRGQTADAATGVRLTAGAQAVSASTTMGLALNSALRFRVLLIASVPGVSAKEWTIEGLVRQGASAATTTFPTAATITSVYGDAGLVTAAVACTADTTNGSINITVNGVAATTINWLAFLQGVEVVG